MKKMKKTKITSKKKKKPDKGKQHNDYPATNEPQLYSKNQMNYPSQQQVNILNQGHPNQQVSPYTQYPPNQGYNQQAPIPNPSIDYSAIASINQLQHQSIFEAENKSLFITLGCTYKVIPFIFFIVGLACIPFGIIYAKDNNKYIVIGLGALFFFYFLYI